MTIFEDPVDAGFEEFGIAATYTAPAGSPLPCTVIRNAEDRIVSFGDSRPFAEGDLIDLRASEVASPVKGAVIALQDGSNKSYTILADPESLDPERLIWTCRCK
jgi:hypothetical protein